MLMGRRTGKLFAVVSALWLCAMTALGSVARTSSSVLSDADEIDGVLRRTQLVDHLYDHVLVRQLEVRTQRGIPIGERTLDVDDADRAALAAAIEHVVPRSWTRRRVRGGMREMGAYLDGDVDRLQLELSLGDRARVLSEATATLGERRQVALRVHRQFVAPRFKETVGPMMSDVLGLPIDDPTLERVALDVVPPDWLEKHALGAVTASEAFMAGDADDFTYRVPLEPVVHRGADVLVEALQSDSTARELLLDRIVDPLIEAHVDEVDWPDGLRLETEVLREIIRVSIPPGWATEKGQLIVRAVERYLIGEVDTLSLEVSIAGRKSALASAVADALVERVSERLKQLPQCSLFEIPGATSALSSGEWPACLPAGPEVVMGVATRRIEDKTDAAFAALPDTLVLDEKTLAAQLGPATLGQLQQARAQVQTGLIIDAASVGLDPKQRPEEQGWLGALRANRFEVRPERRSRTVSLVRNVVSTEWLWWALAALTLATFSLAQPGTGRAPGARGRLDDVRGQRIARE